MIFVTFQMIYVLAITTQIIGFYVTYALRNNVDHSDLLAPEDTLGYMLNTCLSPETTHWADWCTNSMLEGGFFMTPRHRESNVLVIFVMTSILALAMPFIAGLVTLWYV